MKKFVIGFALALVMTVGGAVRAEETSSYIESNKALAYLSVDIENTPGWVAHVKGGYQWNIFKDVGVRVADTENVIGAPGGVVGHERNYTKGGAAAAIAFGYNFGPKIPLTVGLEFGIGPSGVLRKTTNYDAGDGLGDAAGSLYSRQKISMYNLDFHLDYDFKNCSRWTPFIGLTAGLSLVSNKAKARYIDDVGGADDTYSGRFGKKRRINFMGGARLGTKYEVNKCVTLSLYGGYNYLGNVKSKSFTLSNAAGDSVEARTSKVKIHQLELMAGLRISF